MSDTMSGSLRHPLIVVGSLGIGGIAILSTVFFAGAFYNKVDGMETHLTSIDRKISEFGDAESYKRRIESLEIEVAKHHDQLEEHEFYLKSDIPMPKRKP